MKFVNIFLFIITGMAWLACRNHTSAVRKPAVPAVWVIAGEGFEQKQGVLYFHQQPFSGYQYGLFENGDTFFITPYYNGRAEGIARQWYPNKQLKEVRCYINGQKSGEHKGWWLNGTPQFVYHFNNDAFNGLVKEWYVNGRPFRHMQYVNGQENGLQQIWQPNGAVFANYEVRNGRDYGLTGTMHCKNYFTRPDRLQ
jgi:antitoxin component YwqK of YwqJK toxin-antitoxin module